MERLLFSIWLICDAGLIGASFTLGVALVCRALNWAPIVINVTVNNNPPEE